MKNALSIIKQYKKVFLLPKSCKIRQILLNSTIEVESTTVRGDSDKQNQRRVHESGT